MRNVFIYKKRYTLQKSRQFPLGFIYKKHDTLRYAIFHENVEVGTYIYKRNDTLLFVKFFIQKARHFAKRKTFCVTFLYTKIRTLCVTQFFIEFLKLAEEGGTSLKLKTIHFALHFYLQKNALCVMFLYLKFILYY